MQNHIQLLRCAALITAALVMTATPSFGKDKGSHSGSGKDEKVVHKSEPKFVPKKKSSQTTSTNSHDIKRHFKSAGHTGPGRPGGADKPDSGTTKTSTGTPPSTGQSVGNTGPGRPSGTATTSTGSQGTPPPSGSPSKNPNFSGTSVGAARPSGGGDTVKTGTSNPASSSPGGKGDTARGPAGTDTDAATADDSATKKRARPADAEQPKAASRTDKSEGEARAAGAAAPSGAAAGTTAPAAAAVTRTAGPATTGAAAIAGGAAVAATAVAYSHNNSTMKFVPDGDTVRVVYDKPRDGLGALGIAPGTPLFVGKKTGPNTYAGEATTFSRKCGAAAYPVAGEASGGTVTLRGQKPVRGGDCNVSGYTSETLVFDAN